jgi:hypothetical protein
MIVSIIEGGLLRAKNDGKNHSKLVVDGVSLLRVFQRLHYRGYYWSYYRRQDKRVVNDKSYRGRLTRGQSNYGNKISSHCENFIIAKSSKMPTIFQNGNKNVILFRFCLGIV